MDRHELVFDMLDHPEHYTSDQIAELLSDPETREIYNLLCKTESAVATHKNNGQDLEAEWNRFKAANRGRSRLPFRWMGNRAASIAAIICTSIVAVAAGIAVSLEVMERQSKPIPTEKLSVPVSSAVSEQSIAQTDTIRQTVTPKMFEDESLELIMKTIGETYRVEIQFENKDAALLHLYYKLDPTLSLDEVISQLNTFEQINIRRDQSIIVIE